MKRNSLLTGLSIGLSNGLVIPFAVAAGMSAWYPPAAILKTGISVAILCGAAMGLSGYFSVKAELAELKAAHADSPVAEPCASLGLDKDTMNAALEEHAREQAQWSSFLRTHGEAPRRAWTTAIAIGIANVVGGMLPLIPYLFFTMPIKAFPFSGMLAGIGTIGTAILEARLKRQAAAGAVLRALATGGALTVAAYFVARVFTT